MSTEETMLLPQQVTYMGSTGLRLVGDAWGAPEAPPVLLLHGGGQTRHAWGGTAKALARHGWYAVALDMRGHGDSEWCPQGDYMIDTYVADLHNVLRNFPYKPVLVGASLGGMTSLLTEGEASQPVSTAVVLVDVTPRIEQEGADRILSFMTAYPNGFATLEECADHIASYIPHRPRPTDLRGLAKNLRLGPDGRYRWHWDPNFVNPNRRRREPERFLRAARSLAVPTMLVRGKMSDVVSDETTKEFLNCVPHAKYIDVAEAGHMVAGDRNDLFSKAVIEFLTAVRPPV
jgi:pimeloyl-ACP methyl ester carboxylesterase